MHRSKIEWCRNPDGNIGWVWNPITGCLNGCEYCYARRLANTRLRARYLANKNWDARKPPGYVYPEGLEGYPNLNPFYPRFWPERVRSPLRGFQHMGWHKYKGRGIFVCDMSDLFGKGVSRNWTHQVLDTIRIMNKGNQHYFPTDDRFYLLTKQPQELVKWSPFPENCWVGVTATDYWSYVNACNYLSPRIEAKVKYLSLEPLLSWDKHASYFFKSSGINWLIIGAQTKPYKPPKIEWVQEIVEAADKAGIPVFLKNNLWPLFDGSHYAVPLWAFSSKSTLRQEMPE